MYVCLYVRMYVCTYVYIHTHTYIGEAHKTLLAIFSAVFRDSNMHYSEEFSFLLRIGITANMLYVFFFATNMHDTCPTPRK